VPVVCVYCLCNILISGKIIKEMPGSVASGTRCINVTLWRVGVSVVDMLKQTVLRILSVCL